MTTEKIPALTLEINKLLNEIMGNTPEVIDEENEVTARMLAVSSGISDNAARARLEKLAAAGKLIAREARTKHGNKVVAYHRP